MLPPGNPENVQVERQGALRHINLSQPANSASGKQVLVAVLDTGIDSDHGELVGKVEKSVNFTDSPTSHDLHGHGTLIAGIITAQTNNGIGGAGLAPQLKLMNVKVADDSGHCKASVLAQGIRWAVDNGASVINISLELRDFSKELDSVVDYAWNRGCIVVAAAGNDAGNIPVYPAFNENCIAVGAISQTDELAPLSNYGDWVDVAAPGFETCSTAPYNSYDFKTGTSVAAAHVSGLAALLFSVMADDNGNDRTNDEVRLAIENGCRTVITEGIGHGVIDVSRSLNNSW
jgi:thermitase